MTKINDDMTKAFYEGGKSSGGNTIVLQNGKKTSLYLHGSEIARRIGELVAVNVQGFPTKTTLGRLRSLVAEVGGNIWQERGTVYWSGPESSGQARVMPLSGWVLISAGDLMTQVGNLDNVQSILEDK